MREYWPPSADMVIIDCNSKKGQRNLLVIDCINGGKIHRTPLPSMPLWSDPLAVRECHFWELFKSSHWQKNLAFNEKMLASFEEHCYDRKP